MSIGSSGASYPNTVFFEDYRHVPVFLFLRLTSWATFYRPAGVILQTKELVKTEELPPKQRNMLEFPILRFMLVSFW
ncbi:MAG TPA: hypothetical protein DCE41_16055 [Cytophagales bacterium]|nr:hypothetical protein [Cytophagales bacterium]